MSEKEVQSLLIERFRKSQYTLHTEGNKNIFNTNIPDGWIIDEDDKILYIFECKQTAKQLKEAIKQLTKYSDLATNYCKQHNLGIIPIFCYSDANGNTGSTKFYAKLVEDAEISDVSHMTDLNDVLSLTPATETANAIFNPHEFNQYIYDNFPAMSSDERLKIIIGVLLTKSLNIELTPPLFAKVLEVERMYKMDEHFAFITNSPYRECIDKCFEWFSKQNTTSDQLANILTACYAEVSKWSFKGANGSITKKSVTNQEGAVLTPPHITALMTKRLNKSDR